MWLKEEEVIEAVKMDQRLLAGIKSRMDRRPLDEDTCVLLMREAYQTLKRMEVLSEEEALAIPAFRYDIKSKALTFHDMSPDTSHLPDRF